MSKAFNASQPDRSLESIPKPRVNPVSTSFSDKPPLPVFPHGKLLGLPLPGTHRVTPEARPFANGVRSGLVPRSLPCASTDLHISPPVWTAPPTPDHEPTENRNLDLVVSAPIRVSLRHTPALPSRTPEPPAFPCVIFIAPQSTQCSRNRVRDGPQLR